MSELSSHTKLLNIFLCLANKNRACDPVLFKNNYILDTIELQFNKLDGKKIHTDIVFKNPSENNLLFLECKDGRLQNNQSDRYKTLTVEDVKNAHATTLSGEFKLEIAYVGTKDKKEKLIGDIVEHNCKFPLLISDDNKIVIEYNNFNCPVLKNIFSKEGGVKVPNPIQIFYYPFGSNDSDSHILSWIGPVLIGLRGMEFGIDDLLKKTHSLFDYVDEHSLNELKERLSKILNKISKNAMNEFFDLPSSPHKYKLKEFGIKKFQSFLEKCISESEKIAPEYTENLGAFLTSV